MAEFVVHGDPARLAIGVRWVEDKEPRSRRPAVHGWSMGDIRITVGGHVLTRSGIPGHRRDHVRWYLSPVIDWLATNWADLLHEEDFGWQEPSGLPAAVACRKALHAWIGADDPGGRGTYREVQSWYQRHGLRSAASGGLFPDLFVRRLLDDIELSWTASPPMFAPDGFVFVADPGHATLPVDEVAGPLWDALCWFATTPPPALHPDDRSEWVAISHKIRALDALPIQALESHYLSPHAAQLLATIRPAQDLLPSSLSAHAPAITELSPAVAMFGGVSPNLSHGDAKSLLGFLAGSAGQESDVLRSMVAQRGRSPLGVPHRDGQDFAEDLLDELGLWEGQDWIDVGTLVSNLGMSVVTHGFDSQSIRGVALAGPDVQPTLVVNTTSTYNTSFEGQRFTLAHELCHVLHDRSRARRISHVSGPWVAQGFERRANAFAAYFLMPRTLVLRHLGSNQASDPAEAQRVAAALRVSGSALTEHLFNLGLIGDWQREQLRQLFRSPQRVA